MSVDIERPAVERAPEPGQEPLVGTPSGRPTRSRSGKDKAETPETGRARRAAAASSESTAPFGAPRAPSVEPVEAVQARADRRGGAPSPRVAAARYVDVGPLDPAILAPTAYEGALDRLLDRLGTCDARDGTSRRARFVLRADRALLAHLRRDANGLIGG